MKYALPYARLFSVLLAVLLMLLSLGCMAEPLPTPQGIDVALTNDNTVLLQWYPVDEAAGYRVFRSCETSDNYKFKDECGVPQFVDADIKPGHSYFYQVQAIGLKNTSAKSKEVVLTVPSEDNNDEDNAYVSCEPAIHKAVRLNRFTAIIQAKNKPSSAKMEVFRTDKDKEKFEKIGESESNLFYDDTAISPQSYFYKIRYSYVSGHASSAFSPELKLGGQAEVVGIPVVGYHEILSLNDVEKGATFGEYSTYVEEFEQDLIWLKKNGYHLISPSDILNFLNGKTVLPQKPILLIIHDGKAGAFHHAFPVIKEQGVHISLSVIGCEIKESVKNLPNALPPDEEYCTWKQLKEMTDSGFVEIVSNTNNLHAYSKNGRQGASTMEGETADDYFQVAQSDYVAFQGLMMEKLGMTVDAMSYPYSVRNPESDKAWFRCGYKLLIGGEKEMARATRINYFWQPAGHNPWSGILRVLSRIHGEPIEKLLKRAIRQDKG